jgi:hypothetical protein
VGYCPPHAANTRCGDIWNNAILKNYIVIF